MNLEQILRDLHEGTPCATDHHGHCQAHGWLQSNRPCPQRRIEEILTQIPPITEKQSYLLTIKTQDGENQYFDKRIIIAADENEAEATYLGELLTYGGTWYEIGASVQFNGCTIIKSVDSVIEISPLALLKDHIA